jgi:hypothetical protein
MQGTEKMFPCTVLLEEIQIRLGSRQINLSQHDEVPKQESIQSKLLLRYEQRSSLPELFWSQDLEEEQAITRATPRKGNHQDAC